MPKYKVRARYSTTIEADNEWEAERIAIEDLLSGCIQVQLEEDEEEENVQED